MKLIFRQTKINMKNIYNWVIEWKRIDDRIFFLSVWNWEFAHWSSIHCLWIVSFQVAYLRWELCLCVFRVIDLWVCFHLHFKYLFVSSYSILNISSVWIVWDTLTIRFIVKPIDRDDDYCVEMKWIHEPKKIIFNSIASLDWMNGWKNKTKTVNVPDRLKYAQLTSIH